MDAAYNAWADARLVAFLESLETRPPLVDGLLAHLAAAGETWLARLDGTLPPPAIWPTLPFEEAAERLADVDRRLGEPREIDRRVRYRTSTGAEFEDSVGEIVAHMLNHATYHRGEIAGLLLAAGIEPPLTDFVVYLRQKA